MIGTRFHVDLDGRLPALLKQHRVGYVGGGDEAVVDGLYVVAAMPAHSKRAIARDGVLHPGAPPQVRRVERLDLDTHIETGEPLKLFAYNCALELTLGLDIRMLPVAAPAATGPGEWARREYPTGMRVVDLDRVRPTKAPTTVFGDFHGEGFTRQGVTDKKHPALGPRDAMAAVCDSVNINTKLAAQPGRALFGIH